jgi:hypothetical protein
MAELKVVERIASPSAASAHAARMSAAGSSGHPYVQDLAVLHDASTGRDLDDLVHLLGQLYAGLPSLIDLALSQCAAGPVHDWLAGAADAFDRERQLLVRLISAVGPAPSTPGHAETEAAIMAQRHALETLARSERNGCPLGAATALISDWQDIRPLLERAAARVGVSIPPSALPDESGIADVLALAAAGPGPDRAIRFGAEQLLLQHRALFDLLEARSEAREDY